MIDNEDLLVGAVPIELTEENIEVSAGKDGLVYVMAEVEPGIMQGVGVQPNVALFIAEGLIDVALSLLSGVGDGLKQTKETKKNESGN